jgi:thioredoxin reductase (NADPH)
MVYDVIIIGSGPAGLTAAIYSSRANLKTLIIAGAKWGGQLQLTTLVENYPGFPEGIQGPELMTAMRKQAERFGTEIVNVDFKSSDFSARPLKITTSDDKSYEGKSVLIATGADTMWLNIPGEKEKIGRGVSSCAPCDAFFFKGKNVIVVGGGDSAMEEALVLANFATKVTLIHRRDSFRASQIMQDRVKKNEKIKVLFNTEVIEIIGDEKVTGVKIKSTAVRDSRVADNQKKSSPVSEERRAKSEEPIKEMPIDGVFVAIGHVPNSKVFKGVDVDEKGFIKVYDHYKTNIDGVFVSGDVHDSHYKQAVTAAGFGCMAALEIERWLQSTEV